MHPVLQFEAMATCARCHREFNGTPWGYEGDARVHVDCTQSSKFRDETGAPIVPRESTEAPVVKPALQFWSRPFRVQWPGMQCAACGQPIHVGTLASMRQTGVGSKLYKHRSCP